MPPIPKKESPNAVKQKFKPKSVMSRIVPVSEITHETVRMSLYGGPKTGKTRFACTFPKPLLIMGTEEGTASVRN